MQQIAYRGGDFLYYRPHQIQARGLYASVHPEKSTRIRLRLLATALVLITLLLYVNTQLGKLLAKAIEVQLMNVYTDAVNEAVGEVMRSNTQMCGSVVELQRSQDGSICALSTDTASLNILKSELSSGISQRLAELEDEVIYIPLGALTGIEIFSGIGPDIKIRLRLIGGVSTDMSSSFIDAGVNQTLHTIGCSVSARFVAIMPGACTKLELSTDTILAQSIIVGEVPDSYTVVNGDTSDTIGRIFDYGDPYGDNVE